MASDSSANKLPTLVQLCTRVAIQHADAISSFGDDAPIDLIRPIIETCSPDALYRLEVASPHIQEYTTDLWRDLCLKHYSREMDDYRKGEMPEPYSWKDQYFTFKLEQAARLKELTSRIRSQRQQEEGRKKEKEIKITDRLPQMKRSRSNGWGNTQPKSLFQKTRTEVSRIQKNIYTAPKVPPKQLRSILPNSASAAPRAPGNGTNSNPFFVTGKPTPATGVTVRTITIRRPVTQRPCCPSSRRLSTSCDTHTPSGTRCTLGVKDPNSGRPIDRPSNHDDLSATPKKKQKLSSSSPPPPSTKVSVPASTAPLPSGDKIGTPPRSLKSPPKKDPMANLFMPKHRTFSQCRK